jgi:GNAT superfamily N-acetyltransferase
MPGLDDLPYASLRPFCVAIGQASEGARLIELDGVLASLVPASPDRSVVNSVIYEHAEALDATLDRLAAAYEEAGVRAWTVWVPERDRAAAEMLESAGHRLDAQPMGMAMDLAAFDRLPSGDEEVETEPEIREVGRLNDLAYGFGGGDFAGALTKQPTGLHSYVARVDGTPAACLGAIDNGNDCGIYFVATAPEGRGRGLATELMTRALVDGRARGCETTSLQSTKAGHPVYRRLGYRDCGRIEMWERRRGD